MKISAITMVYNEALILPFFLRHYKYLDEIHVLYETDCTDLSLDILGGASNVVVEHCHIEGGIDDIAKTNLINNTLHNMKADWVYVLDPDEFIFPPGETPADFLKRQTGNVVRAALFQVYRHRLDGDLDPDITPVSQRTHGDPNLFATFQDRNRASNKDYIKPIIVRPSRRIRFIQGSHAAVGNIKMSPDFYVGAHWSMADPVIALDRRIKRRERISARNRVMGMGIQNWDVTGEYIAEQCNSHLDDPVIDELYLFGKDRFLLPFFRMNDYNDIASRLKAITFSRLISKIRKHVTGNRLLNIGYSGGLFLEIALKSGFDGYAIEYSNTTLSLIKPFMQERVTRGSEKVSPDGKNDKYDVIVVANTFEHVKKSAQFLQEIRQILTRGGMLVIITPDAKYKLKDFITSRWPMLKPLNCAITFSKQTMKDTLSAAGFSNIRIDDIKTELSMEYLLSQAQEYNSLLGKIYSVISRLLPSFIKKKTFSFNIGEFVAFAKEPE